MNKIQVTVKNVYGNNLIYPVCDQAQRFAGLTRKKTLDAWDLKVIKEIGFEVELVAVHNGQVVRLTNA